MVIIYNNRTEPYFNIALEEYLFKKFDDDIFMLYRNEPSIIVGKHQNTLKEINTKFVRKNNIKVIRRISGGGTVYHDLGNVNFTFIQNGEYEKLADFKKYTAPIIQVLQNLGVDAKLSGRNDIIVDNLKISGNAEHTFKNRVLHHGTILFSSDLKQLSAALKQNSSKYIDKSVPSVRSKVTNVRKYLKKILDIDEFIELIYNQIRYKFFGAVEYQLNLEDLKVIEELVENKYSRWEWNYQYVSNYFFNNQIDIGKEIVTVQMQVKNGLIQNIIFQSNFDLSFLENLLQNKEHKFELVEKQIESFLETFEIKNFTKDLLLELLF
ncbi:MAG: lipoate--protein ligase [Candidatus Kapaibacteriota bacterium]